MNYSHNVDLFHTARKTHSRPSKTLFQYLIQGRCDLNSFRAELIKHKKKINNRVVIENLSIFIHLFAKKTTFILIQEPINFTALAFTSINGSSHLYSVVRRSQAALKQHVNYYYTNIKYDGRVHVSYLPFADRAEPHRLRTHFFYSLHCPSRGTARVSVIILFCLFVKHIMYTYKLFFVFFFQFCVRIHLANKFPDQFSSSYEPSIVTVVNIYICSLSEQLC